jgi:hypothetical protein
LSPKTNKVEGSKARISVNGQIIGEVKDITYSPTVPDNAYVIKGLGPDVTTQDVVDAFAYSYTFTPPKQIPFSYYTYTFDLLTCVCGANKPAYALGHKPNCCMWAFKVVADHFDRVGLDTDKPQSHTG